MHAQRRSWAGGVVAGAHRRQVGCYHRRRLNGWVSETQPEIKACIQTHSEMSSFFSRSSPESEMLVCCWRARKVLTIRCCEKDSLLTWNQPEVDSPERARSLYHYDLVEDRLNVLSQALLFPADCGDAQRAPGRHNQREIKDVGGSATLQTSCCGGDRVSPVISQD